jgi:aryl carrier-like protein
VLGLPVRASDNFLQLGGDSFSAMRVASRSGDRVNVADLFSHETLASLAEHVAATHDHDTAG